MSSIQSVIKKEASDNRINPDAKDLEGSFISSGKIGQWKEHYSEEEYNYFYKKFKSCGVNFEDFIFE